MNPDQRAVHAFREELFLPASDTEVIYKTFRHFFEPHDSFPIKVFDDQIREHQQFHYSGTLNYLYWALGFATGSTDYEHYAADKMLRGLVQKGVAGLEKVLPIPDDVEAKYKGMNIEAQREPYERLQSDEKFFHELMLRLNDAETEMAKCMVLPRYIQEEALPKFNQVIGDLGQINPNIIAPLTRMRNDLETLAKKLDKTIDRGLGNLN